jgi:hypothetical protein
MREREPAQPGAASAALGDGKSRAETGVRFSVIIGVPALQTRQL